MRSKKVQKRSKRGPKEFQKRPKGVQKRSKRGPNDLQMRSKWGKKKRFKKKSKKRSKDPKGSKRIWYERENILMKQGFLFLNTVQAKECFSHMEDSIKCILTHIFDKVLRISFVYPDLELKCLIKMVVKKAPPNIYKRGVST